MALLRRTRGAVLRLARNRPLSIAAGALMIAPAAYAQFSGRVDAWWVEGLSLIVGATGIALVWTGLIGVAPDWIEDK